MIIISLGGVKTSNIGNKAVDHAVDVEDSGI